MDITRHRTLFNSERFNTPIQVIGCGASGSFLVLQLAKLGIRPELINIYDDDIIESHNIANQCFLPQQVGQHKAEAIREVSSLFAGDEYKNIRICRERIGSERIRLPGYVFCMTDTMLSRETIWKKQIKLNQHVELYIEPRMGVDLIHLYTVKPLDIAKHKKYEDTLYGDEVAEVSACGTSLTIIPSAMIVASLCVKALIDYNRNEKLEYSSMLFDTMYGNLVCEQ